MLRPLSRALVVAGFVLAVTATPAAAQFLGKQEGATPEMVAKASAEAERLLDEAGAKDFFENVTVGIDPRVRHRRSGLVCSFTPGSEHNKVMIFDSTPDDGTPRGDDVGCNTSLGDIHMTHYATRYAEPYTPQFLAEDAGRAIRQRWPNAEPFEGTVATVVDDENPPTSSVRFLIGSPEKRGYTHALTAEIGGWSFKQRLTAPGDSALGAQVLGGDTWNIVLRLARTQPGGEDI